MANYRCAGGGRTVRVSVMAALMRRAGEMSRHLGISRADYLRMAVTIQIAADRIRHGMAPHTTPAV